MVCGKIEFKRGDKCFNHDGGAGEACWAEGSRGVHTTDHKVQGASPTSLVTPCWGTLRFTEANVHFRSAITNGAGALLPQGCGTKVFSVLSPDLLTNSADRFTGEPKAVTPGILSTLGSPRKTAIPKQSVSLTGLPLF